MRTSCLSLQCEILMSGEEASPKQHTIVNLPTGRSRNPLKTPGTQVEAWLVYLQAYRMMDK